MSQRSAGLIKFKRNGVQERAKGNFTYNLGKPVRETIIGSDGNHGYKETPQPCFIEGEITDRADLVLADLVTADDQTVILELGNGKVIALSEAYFVGEGTGNTEEANIAVRFEGAEAEEILP